MQETLETNYFQTNGHLVFFVCFFYIINSCYNNNILDKRFQIYFFLASGVTSTVDDVILQVTYAVINSDNSWNIYCTFNCMNQLTSIREEEHRKQLPHWICPFR